MGREQILGLLKDHTPQEVAQKLGISVQRVYKARGSKENENRTFDPVQAPKIRLSRQYLLKAAWRLEHIKEIKPVEVIELLISLASVCKELADIREREEREAQAKEHDEVNKLVVVQRKEAKGQWKPKSW